MSNLLLTDGECESLAKARAILDEVNASLTERGKGFMFVAAAITADPGGVPVPHREIAASAVLSPQFIEP